MARPISDKWEPWHEFAEKYGLALKQAMHFNLDWFYKSSPEAQSLLISMAKRDSEQVAERSRRRPPYKTMARKMAERCA